MNWQLKRSQTNVPLTFCESTVHSVFLNFYFPYTWFSSLFYSCCILFVSLSLTYLKFFWNKLKTNKSSFWKHRLSVRVSVDYCPGCLWSAWTLQKEFRSTLSTNLNIHWKAGDYQHTDQGYGPRKKVSPVRTSWLISTWALVRNQQIMALPLTTGQKLTKKLPKAWGVLDLEPTFTLFQHFNKS